MEDNFKSMLLEGLHISKQTTPDNINRNDVTATLLTAKYGYLQIIESQYCCRLRLEFY